MKMFQRMFIAGVFAIVATVTSIGYAQEVPAKLVGTGAFNSSDLTFEGDAIGSHLGNCSFAGVATLSPADNTGLVLNYFAPDVYTAANGDTLELIGIGTTTLTPVGVNGNGEPVFTAVWDGTWTVVGGTGRFSNASGAYELYAENLPFAFSDPYWYFIYEKTGTIDLGNE